MGQLANIILQQIEGMHLGYCPPTEQTTYSKKYGQSTGFPFKHDLQVVDLTWFLHILIYFAYIWVTYNNSLTWILWPFGDDFPLKTMIPGFGRTGFGRDEFYPDICLLGKWIPYGPWFYPATNPPLVGATQELLTTIKPWGKQQNHEALCGKPTAMKPLVYLVWLWFLSVLKPLQMEVSWNGDTPKSSFLIGFSIINQLFWGSLVWKPPDGTPG